MRPAKVTVIARTHTHCDTHCKRDFPQQDRIGLQDGQRLAAAAGSMVIIWGNISLFYWVILRGGRKGRGPWSEVRVGCGGSPSVRSLLNLLKDLPCFPECLSYFTYITGI